jgi:hypothetical protein
MENAFRPLAVLAGEDLREALRGEPPLVEGLLDPEAQEASDSTIETAHWPAGVLRPSTRRVG